MKTVNKKDLYSILFLTIMYVLCFSLTKDTILNNSDSIFLINRAKQMIDCIKDGNIPFFYYNDFNGVGYGSSFFYGHLTLYPFLPLLLVSDACFMTGYTIAIYIINFIGVYKLSQRLTDNYKLVTILYMSSTFMLTYTFYISLYTNLLGVGLSFMFIAHVIDYMRHASRKSLLLSGVYYFLIINTHLLSAVICFLCTIIILVYYFDKKRLKNYVKFALYICLLCSYFIANFFYHSECINNLNEINKYIFSDSRFLDRYTIPIFPFELLGKCILKQDYNGINIVDLITLIFLILTLYKNKKLIEKKKKALLVFVVLILIFSLKPIWTWFNTNVFMLPFQFSFRLLPYIMIVVYSIILDKVSSKDTKLYIIVWNFIYLTIFVIFLSLLSSPRSINNDNIAIGNGEYLSSNFGCSAEEFSAMSSSITDNEGNLYNFIKEAGAIKFDISAERDLVLTLPSLYYKGYVAYLDDSKELEVSEGYSQFVKLYIPSGTDGHISVYYKHPVILIFLDLLCLVIVSVSIFRLNYKYYRKESKL